MAKYHLTIGFYTDRDLSEDELGSIQHDCIAQIEDPSTLNGDRATYATILDGCDIDELGTTYGVRTDSAGQLYLGKVDA
jgi:hypothetical protein